MVLRTDLLNTIGVIAALLLPITTTENLYIITTPKEVGFVIGLLSNTSYFANLYSIVGTLSASYWAVAYEVYGDVKRPLVGLILAFISLLIEMVLGTTVACFDLVDRQADDAYKLYKTHAQPSMIPFFLIWIIPFSLMLIAMIEMYIMHRIEAIRWRTQRKDQELPLVDPENRRKDDPFSVWDLDGRRVTKSS